MESTATTDSIRTTDSTATTGTTATTGSTDSGARPGRGRSSEPMADSRLVDVAWWRRWLGGRAGAARWAAWSGDHRSLRGWSVEELLSPTSSARTDAMQATLVLLAQSGEGDAAQLLVVQLRPGLHRLARWTVGTGRWPWHESIDEVRATFFETLYRHRLDRRPTKIAANLLLDTRQRIHRSQQGSQQGSQPGSQRVRGSQQVRDPAQTGYIDWSNVGVHPITNPAIAAVLRVAIEQLPGSEKSRRLTANLAYRAWILDEPQTAIAADLGIETGVVKSRLHRLRSTLDPQDFVA